MRRTLPGVSGAAPGGPGTTFGIWTWRAKTASAPRRTPPRKCGSRWPTACCPIAYYPTIESSNVKTVQYIVTDGKTFADLQERDMTYTVSSTGSQRHGVPGDEHRRPARVPDRHGLHHGPGHRQHRHAQQAGTPSRAPVRLRRPEGVRPLQPAHRQHRRRRVIQRGANNAAVDPATTALVATDTEPATGPGPFAATVYGALAASKPFLAESAGFAGTPSDGLSQLDASPTRADQPVPVGWRPDRNVTLTALVRAAPGTPFTLTLGFGVHRRNGY